MERTAERTGNHAVLVAAGIFLSRIFGLVRQHFISHYFGLSDPGDAFTQAFKIPNLLRNLFGEGSLSASFIPVYARLLAEKDEEEAGRVAGAVFALLALAVSVLVLIGVAATPYIIDLIAAGFTGAKRELTIRLVRILFIGAGFLVMSAWCLGILNSHRKFFLSYASPVMWNLAMIVCMVLLGRSAHRDSLAVALAWASVIGSALTFAVQLPSVLRLVKRLRIHFAYHGDHVPDVVRNFVPVFFSRGVVQISTYVDLWLASWLPTGAPTALYNASLLYLLPVSLFGMSVSDAELPAMSSALGAQAEIAGYLRQRLNRGLRQIAFFVVPSSMGFLALGGVVAAALYQTGRFSHADAQYVWGILAGASVGLVAQTLGRLYSSTYYALRDTRTPMRYAVVRVCLTSGLGYLFALPLPRWLGIDPGWGAAGLTSSAGIAGWVEFSLLRHTLNGRIGRTGLPASLVARLWGSAAVAAAAGWAVKLALGPQGPKISGAAILSAYVVVYFAATYALRVPECGAMLERALAQVSRVSRRDAR